MKIVPATLITIALTLSACGGGGTSDMDQIPSSRVLSNDVSPNGTLGDVNAQ